MYVFLLSASSGLTVFFVCYSFNFALSGLFLGEGAGRRGYKLGVLVDHAPRWPENHSPKFTPLSFFCPPKMEILILLNCSSRIKNLFYFLYILNSIQDGDIFFCLH